MQPARERVRNAVFSSVIPLDCAIQHLASGIATRDIDNDDNDDDDDVVFLCRWKVQEARQESLLAAFENEYDMRRRQGKGKREKLPQMLVDCRLSNAWALGDLPRGRREAAATDTAAPKTNKRRTNSMSGGAWPAYKRCGLALHAMVDYLQLAERP